MVATSHDSSGFPRNHDHSDGHLFARWAVRRKALRPSVEIDGVIRRVQCLALINNGISFTLINASTGTRLVSSHKARSVATIFGQLFGDAKARTLI